jgi:lysophosphatidylcholine acyltransferase/lyso-PAF acetyltransferase
MEGIAEYRVPLLLDDDDKDANANNQRSKIGDTVVDIDSSECHITSNNNTTDNNNGNGNGHGNGNGNIIHSFFINREEEVSASSANYSDCSSTGNEEDNPFSFMGNRPPSLGSPSSIDPFRNHTPDIVGLYEWIKIVICLPLAVVRLVLFGLVLAVGFLATKLAIQGWNDRHNPMPKWRCRIMLITRLSSRCILFCFGYHWIRRSGKPASREVAPIVVSNHVSYTDPIFFFYELFPSIVSSESHDQIPFVGTIIRAMQVIYVDRFSPASRKHAVAEINRKASCHDFPRVLLFPEGTTTNGRALISFQLGAFIPGFPVQPVIIRYPHVHFDQSWGTVSLLKLMFRMFTQFHNFMEVEYLPVIFPLEDKKETPVLLAKKVRYAMSRALNVVQTEHSYGDLMLASRASEIGMDPASAYMVEMAYLERLFRLSIAEALGFLDRFTAMGPDHSGCVNIDNFLLVLGLGRNSFSEKIFHYIDLEKQGAITFREFIFLSTFILKQPKFHLFCELAFKFCDINNRRFLSKQEVERVMKLVIPDLTEENVYRMFKLLDVDNDKAISWNDFSICLERNPILIALFGSQISLD